MVTPTVVHEDDHGSMIDYHDDDYLEVRWYDASSALTTDTLRQRQEVIASVVEQYGRACMLVDLPQPTVMVQIKREEIR